MKIILGVRGSGKTTRLIQESSKTGYYIITRNKNSASWIFEQSTKMKLEIPFPLTYQEFFDKQYYGKRIDGFLIDELESFLMYVSKVPIRTVTLTPTEVLTLKSSIIDYKEILKNSTSPEFVKMVTGDWDIEE